MIAIIRVKGESIQPMTDEERQRAMDFIVEQQAQFSVNQQKSDEHISRLERIVKLIVNAGRRTRGQIREMDERFEQRFAKLMIRAGRRERHTRSEADERLTKALAELAEAQKRTEASIAHTDSKLDAL